jgi:hypothetical protein
MEGKKNSVNLYELAKEYAVGDLPVIKADLKKRFGERWFQDNWAKFNKHRNTVKWRPPEEVRQDVLEDKEN